MSQLISFESIEDKIYLIRGKKMMLDYDLAQLYDVETKYLKRQVKRNIKRFPLDFMFELSDEEYQAVLRCQNVTSKRGGRRYLPYAFTEQGISMLSSVLNCEKAVQINILIMRTFVKIREFLYSHKDLVQKIKELERIAMKNSSDIQTIFEAIRQLIAIEEKPKKKIGFLRD